MVLRSGRATVISAGGTLFSICTGVGFTSFVTLTVVPSTWLSICTGVGFTSFVISTGVGFTSFVTLTAAGATLTTGAAGAAMLKVGAA